MSQDQHKNKLLDFYEERAAINALWCCRDSFSKLAAQAIRLYPSDNTRTDLTAAACYFIDYTAIFLINKPYDLLYLFESFSSEETVKFMQTYSRNPLINFSVLNALVMDKDTILNIGRYEEWIELPIRKRAGKLIPLAQPFSVDPNMLFPSQLDIPPYLVSYLLSWAYEEDKLSESGKDYLREQFPDKYSMLLKIKERPN